MSDTNGDLREPKIPMHPDEVPQQRIHLLVDLPPRPEGFHAKCDFMDSIPEYEAPQRGPRRADYLGSTEWAWSPMHSRLDAYYLNRRRSHWLLCICSEDENSWDRRWRWYLYGYAPPLRISAEEAAIYMLLDCWKAEADGSSFDHFHWINDTGLLSVAEITAIGREVWPEVRASLSE